jgi:hypothetical protein
MEQVFEFIQMPAEEDAPLEASENQNFEELKLGKSD